MYSALAGACKERITQNKGIGSRIGRFYVHGNKKLSTERKKFMGNDYEHELKEFQRRMEAQKAIDEATVA